MKKIVSILGLIILCAFLTGCSLLNSSKYKNTYNFYVDNELYTSYTVTSLDNLTLPSAPVKEGYTFVGWLYNDNLISDIQSLTLANYDLYASFSINHYTLYVDGEIFKTDIPYNSNVSLPLLEKEGYTFNGYKDSVDTRYHDNIVIKSDTYLESVYVLNTYYLTYDNQNIAYTILDDTISLPVLNKEGYDFQGYKVDDEPDIIQTYVVKNYSLTWHTLTPIYTPHEITVNYCFLKQSVSLKAYSLNPIDYLEKSIYGYEFKGWYLDEDYTQPCIDTLYPTYDITYYGQYELITYTLTFLDLRDAVFKTLTYTVEDTIILPQFAQKGYDFTGWLYQDEVYNDTLPVNLGNITLTPQCHLSTYYITLENNVIPYTILDTIELPLKSQKGYTFFGYQINGSNQDYLILNTDTLSTLASDFTLIPHFEANTYEIAFNTRGGEAIEKLSVKYGELITLPTASKSYTQFVGWYWDEILNKPFDATVMGDENITLYASYTQDFKVVLNYQATVNDSISCLINSGSSYLYGSYIELRAKQYVDNYSFSGWYKDNILVSYDTDVWIYGDNDYSYYAQYSLISYQKYSLNDLSHVELTYTKVPTSVMGSGLTANDYILADTIILNESYLSQLDAGYYSFYTDQGEYLYLELYYDDVTPCDISLDYDRAYPSVIIDFYGTGNYSLYLNDKYYGVCYSGMMIEGYDKARNNTIIINESRGFSTQYEKKGYEEDQAEYYNTSFNLGGKSYDYVMESVTEFNAWLKYEILIDGPLNAYPTTNYPYGTYTSYCFIASNLRDWTGAEMISNGLRTFSVPCGLYYSYEYRKEIYTVYLYYATSFNTELSTQSLTVLTDNQGCLTQSNRSSDYTDFKINHYNKMTYIQNLYDLESLAYGYKPICKEGSREEEVLLAAMDVCRNYISDTMNDFEKVKVFYDWIALNVTYDSTILSLDNQGAYRSHTSYGVLIDHLGVCDGISKTMKLLCNIEGIECIEVVGSGQGGGHAWNKVCIDGCWYALDATWARTKNLYVSHMFLFMDEAYTITTQHSEMAQAQDPYIVYLATGSKNYYNRTIINAEKGYDLVVDSKSELSSILTWGKQKGLKVIDVETSYSDANSFKMALKWASLTSGVSYSDCVGYGYTAAGYVYYITLQ